MIHRLIARLDEKIGFEKVSAHCDIPCGIYDPVVAQINALTVIRMVDLITELEGAAPLSVADQAKLGRLVAQKETHALKVKEEVRVIWGDYFKQPQFDQVAGIHDLVHSIMMEGSKCRQSVDRAAAVELLNLVNQFAQAFWKTKGVETYTAVCPYPPSEKLVYPKLGE